MEEKEPEESGYMESESIECCVGSAMRDVEVIHVTATNVIARGRRYGRQWFLKGLREEFRNSASMLRRLQKEFEIHSRLRHPNIVQAVGLEEVEGLGPCIIQEWVDGKTLHEMLRCGNMTASERRRVLRELTEAVAYLHRSGVVHRDIKPSNIMIRKTGGEAVLIDFGLADTDDYVEIKASAGTPGFISPEQMKGGGASPADDVYSLGMVIKEMGTRYKRIGNKCTGSPAIRPGDAGEVLKAYSRRDRRPKIIIAVILAAIIALVTGAVQLRFKSLEKSADSSKEQLAVLTDKNVGNEKLVTTLRDSLNEMHGKLASTQDELTRIREYEGLRQALFGEGCSRIDSVLGRYDRDVFSKMPEEDIGKYNEVLLGLVVELKATVEGYISSIKNRNDLAPGDADKLKMDLYNYQAVKLFEYQKKWEKKTRPVMQKAM